MVKYSKRKYNKSKRRYNKSKRKYNKTKRRYNKTKRRYIKKRYSKKNQHGGMDFVRSIGHRARRQFSPEPEIIVREHRYADLKRPLIHSAISSFSGRHAPPPILPYKFKNNAHRQFGGIYKGPEWGLKMYVIGIACSTDNGRTYNKRVINRDDSNALLQNHISPLYFSHLPLPWPDNLEEQAVLKIFFLRGFSPLYTIRNIHRGKLARMISLFYQGREALNMGDLSESMANQFFFNVPTDPGEYGAYLETEMRDLIINNRRNLQGANSAGLADGTTLIPVAIDHHLIIDDNPDRQKLNNILTHYPPPADEAARMAQNRVRLSFLHSPIHLDAPPRPPPPPPRPPPTDLSPPPNAISTTPDVGNYTEI